MPRRAARTTPAISADRLRNRVHARAVARSACTAERSIAIGRSIEMIDPGSARRGGPRRDDAG